ncbi:hypothetical protein [Aminipila sp.]|uniref:hypothetical protein n=1 Tax=Aminipila sp. TaxID=2060095 RepID=UPI002897046C|nr:hypothetical protein [Aminipila sp.]
MKDISFDTGMIELAIQGDKNRVLRFNPEDVDFQNSLFAMLDHASEKMKEFEQSAKEYDAKVNQLGEIEAAKEKIKIQCDIDNFIKNEIDGVFGAGIANMIFQEASPSAKSSSGQYIFMNFFDALLPIIQPEIKKRNESIQKIIADHRKKVIR